MTITFITTNARCDDDVILFRTFRGPVDQQLEYALVLPEDFDEEKVYPVLLALPPGNQSRQMVEAGLDRYWGQQAREKNWIVISPIAPTEQSFTSGAEALIPLLLDEIERTYNIEGKKFHLAGASNGGRSAFRVALNDPDRFLTMMVLPGFPPTEAEYQELPKLRDLSIFMYVGSEDTRWIEPMQRAKESIESASGHVVYMELPGEGHVPPSLDGPFVMSIFDAVHHNLLDTPRTAPASEERVAAVLDELHDAASKADGVRYFNIFARDAVFMGTDATERWTLDQFRAYAMQRFEQGTGWTYHVTERHIAFNGRDDVAWFDEMLTNKKYGTTRGSGVLIRHGRDWKIAQYNLSIPIPNNLALDVVKQIREYKD